MHIKFLSCFPERNSVCRCLPSTDVILCGSSGSHIDVVCVLLACGYVIAFYSKLFNYAITYNLCGEESILK
jgi:hypothetical protein